MSLYEEIQMAVRQVVDEGEAAWAASWLLEQDEITVGIFLFAVRERAIARGREEVV